MDGRMHLSNCLLYNFITIYYHIHICRWLQIVCARTDRVFVEHCRLLWTKIGRLDRNRFSAQFGDSDDTGGQDLQSVVRIVWIDQSQCKFEYFITDCCILIGKLMQFNNGQFKQCKIYWRNVEVIISSPDFNYWSLIRGTGPHLGTSEIFGKSKIGDWGYANYFLKSS